MGASPGLQAVLARVAKVAPTDSTVLITGETGTGKVGPGSESAIHPWRVRSSSRSMLVNRKSHTQLWIGADSLPMPSLVLARYDPALCLWEPNFHLPISPFLGTWYYNERC